MFRLRREADRWFRYLFEKGPIGTKFDAYHLCLMLGLKRGQLDEATDSSEIYGKFPQEYAGSRYQIIALLISVEMRREGLDFSNHSASQSMVARYIDPENPASLSKEGFGRLNSYASGGFNLLSAAFAEPPRDVNAFLVRYTDLLI